MENPLRCCRLTTMENSLRCCRLTTMDRSPKAFHALWQALRSAGGGALRSKGGEWLGAQGVIIHVM